MASVQIALALGLISALWAINSPPGENYNVTNGAWRTNLAIGSSQADLISYWEKSSGNDHEKLPLLAVFGMQFYRVINNYCLFTIATAGEP